MVDLPIGHGCREIDFGRGPKLAMPIPWGDVAIASSSTRTASMTGTTGRASNTKAGNIEQNL